MTEDQKRYYRERQALRRLDPAFRAKEAEQRKTPKARELMLAAGRRWYHRNKAKRAEAHRKWAEENRDKTRATDKRAHLKNPHIKYAKNARRRARCRLATPQWLSSEQKHEMALFYKNRPVGQHVDHIVPLNGKEVSGLNVPWNLQYLSALDNNKKNNKLCAI